MPSDIDLPERYSKYKERTQYKRGDLKPLLIACIPNLTAPSAARVLGVSHSAVLAMLSSYKIDFINYKQWDEHDVEYPDTYRLDYDLIND